MGRRLVAASSLPHPAAHHYIAHAPPRNVAALPPPPPQIYEDALASTLADGVMAVAHGVDMSSQAFRDRAVPEQEAIRVGGWVGSSIDGGVAVAVL